MAKLKIKTLRISNNSSKTIKECYTEYMDYCKSIRQRDATLTSKERFYTYELTKMIGVEENISKLTKERIQKHINSMRDKGYKGNYY